MSAALGVFIALIAGSALRSNLATAVPPEPPAWSAPTADMDTHAGLMQIHPTSRSASIAARSWTPANKTNKKPFRSAWMTKERPLTWNRLSPQSVLTPAPLSLTPMAFAPTGIQARAPAAIPYDRDILTQLCVARR